MYKVIKLFTDMQDRNYKYSVGDTYPREGLEPTAERKAELSGSNNKQGVPLIEVIAENANTTEETVSDAETVEGKPKRRKRKE